MQYDLISKTFGEYRRTRFKDCFPGQEELLEYLEQLALSTGTNIDNLIVQDHFGAVPLRPLDRRAVNRIFFSLKHSDIEKPAIPADLLANASAALTEMTETRLAACRQERRSKLSAAELSYARYQEHVGKAWSLSKEIYALSHRPATYLTDELRKLLQESFWLFASYRDGVLYLTTAQAVVLRESNKAAGVHRVIPMGWFKAELRMSDMRLRVLRHKQNAISSGHWHPYIADNGDICWGNAAGTARAMLVEGKIYEVFCLLASLLTTYSDGTPYQNLYDFEDCTCRYDAGEAIPERCDSCDEDPCECGRCEYCDRVDDCECSRCENCERVTEECDCFRCPRCDWLSQRRQCDTHWCGICETDNAQTCGCCSECENEQDDCTCCRDCGVADGTPHVSTCDAIKPESETPF